MSDNLVKLFYLCTYVALRHHQGLWPVTSKLVVKIEAGKFVDMAELLLHRWGVTKSQTGNEPSRAPKPRQCTVIMILEWVQCFSIYLAVIVNKQPQRIPCRPIGLPDTHHRLTVATPRAWMGYNCRFCQRAAANPHIP